MYSVMNTSYTGMGIWKKGQSTPLHVYLCGEEWWQIHLVTHPVLIIDSVMPEMDEVDDVCVLELYEPLKNLDKHLLATTLTVGVAHLIPDHLHSIVCVHGQEGSINARDITSNLHTYMDRGCGGWALIRNI